MQRQLGGGSRQWVCFQTRGVALHTQERTRVLEKLAGSSKEFLIEVKDICNVVT